MASLMLERLSSETVVIVGTAAAGRPDRKSWSLAQRELRLSELLIMRGWWMGERHRPIKPSTPIWRSSGLPNAGEAVVGDSP